MSWQKIAKDAFLQYCRALDQDIEDPSKEFDNFGDTLKEAWEMAARQAVWSWQMGMQNKEPELMIVLTPEMEK